MGRNSKNTKSSKTSGRKAAPSELLAEIDAMSSDEESSDEHVTGGAKEILIPSKSEEDSDDDGDLNAEAQALRQAISEGVFDKLAEMIPKSNDAKGDLEENSEEVNQLDPDESGHRETIRKPSGSNHKALLVATEDLQSNFNRLPWPERFTVTPESVLPFQDKASRLEIHDDLKREVAFYDLALEAVQQAKQKSNSYHIPFSRPEDFFAEMVKTDEHMAKVKDRLIFEGKKIAAVEQRKNNKQHKVRAKEVQQQKLVEKSQRKKDHMQKVSDWAKAAAQNRGGGGRAIGDNDDDAYLARFEGGKNAKREAADKKYGHGKKGRFDRKPDKKSLNDMSGYSKQVYERKMNKPSSAGSSRPGKRARDAQRSKK